MEVRYGVEDRWWKMKGGGNREGMIGGPTFKLPIPDPPLIERRIVGGSRIHPQL
jgi:hypothetical protein